MNHVIRQLQEVIYTTIQKLLHKMSISCKYQITMTPTVQIYEEKDSMLVQQGHEESHDH